MKNAIFAGLIAALASAGVAQASTNVAAGLPSLSYSQSSTWGGHTAESLFNGGNWNAGAFGTQWVQVDLLSSQDISSVSYVLDMLPNGHVSQQIFVSDNAIGANWNSLTAASSFDGAGAAGQPIVQNFAAHGRYLEIVANGGPSWTALSNATVTAVPEPDSIAMLLAGLGIVGAIARRRKQD